MQRFITVRPRGVPVSVIVGSIADDATPEQIVNAWPQLTKTSRLPSNSPPSGKQR